MDIRSHLAQGRPLLFDGAMGTCFAALPGRAGERCESANLDHPEEILSIHRAYLDAGCQAVKTNTFSVGVDLAQGNDALARGLIEAGARLAREAAEPYGAAVFADLGPAPQSQDQGPAELYLRQADLFLAQGLTHFLVETLPSDEGIPELARHLKSRCPEAFLIVSFAVGSDGVTREGRVGRELLRRIAALPEVDAVGYNCVSGPSHMLRQLEGLDLGGTFLSAMPNAGYPTVLGRRTVYQGTPDYFAQRLEQLVQAGAAIVGGCCGTTPEHIARMTATLARSSIRRPGTLPGQPHPHRAAPKSPLWDKLDSGKRVVAVELDPPVDDDIAPFLEGVRILRDAGVDAVTIADCPVGRPRADSSILACKVRRELGVEPLPHLTCRDRNLNATKALLLGLSMEGVHNVLLVTGDPIPSTDRDEVKSVFNFNSRKLARYTSSLNEGTLNTPFRIFGALNLNARNFDVQLRLAREKEECGVSGFLTQPVLSPEALENLKRARAALKGKILGGVFPVVSYKNALFLNNEVSGIRVSDEIIALYEGKSREEGEDLAVQISTRVAREIAPYTDGLYLMTPFRRVHLITRILRSIQQ
ncbi:Methylenetetrahydrofolate reductase [uncultured Eubacteriales bacterium]|uniref:Methylenetetrahydrofolate reductase n=1 Tax=uncultured Eubacteriales bacterium TaxID=172733 RepID=A0A212JBZ6_9FIRM|nr:Methylenetetrahydrofolate reductase [uncultured Eubacteriales bacterium]